MRSFDGGSFSGLGDGSTAIAIELLKIYGQIRGVKLALDASAAAEQRAVRDTVPFSDELRS